MTDMLSAPTADPSNSPRWAECPLEPRVRNLEGKMAVAVRDIESLEGDVEDLPDCITKLRESVASLKAYAKVTWALLLGLILSILGTAVSIWYGGGLP